MATNHDEKFFGVSKRGFEAPTASAKAALADISSAISFRYMHRVITDAQCTAEALKRIEGKHLSYRLTFRLKQRLKSR